jgi:hypothetical protein
MSRGMWRVRRPFPIAICDPRASIRLPGRAEQYDYCTTSNPSRCINTERRHLDVHQLLPGVRTSSRHRVGARTAQVAFVTALGPSTVRASATEGNWYQDSFNGRTADTPVGVVKHRQPPGVQSGTWHRQPAVVDRVAPGQLATGPGRLDNARCPRDPHRQRPALGVHPRSERRQRVLQPAHRCDSGPVVRWTWFPGPRIPTGSRRSQSLPAASGCSPTIVVLAFAEEQRGLEAHRVRGSSSGRRACLSSERAGSSDFFDGAQRPKTAPASGATDHTHRARGRSFSCTR